MTSAIDNTITNPTSTTSADTRPGDTPEAFTEEESTVAELRRIDFTGTMWFGAAIVAIGIPLAGLLAAGWRPSDLPMPAEVAWWVGAAFTFIGIAGFGWAGCPVLAWPVPVANRQKSICIRGGVGLYLAGTIIALIAVLSVG